MDIVNTLEHFGQLILNRFGIEISLVYWWWVIQGSHSPSLFLLQQPTDVVRFVLVQTTPESVLTQYSGGVVDVEWYSWYWYTFWDEWVLYFIWFNLTAYFRQTYRLFCIRLQKFRRFKKKTGPSLFETFLGN